MKPLLLALLMGMLASATVAAEAPVVGFDNFTSLSLVSKGSMGKRSFQLVVANDGTATRTAAGFTTATIDTRRLRLLDYVHLFATLNSARIPAIVGNYHEHGLMDGRDEDLTLNLVDAAGKTQAFEVHNYGASAPKPFYEVMGFLEKLLETATTAAPPTVTRGNFKWLSWQVKFLGESPETTLIYDGGIVRWGGKAKEATSFTLQDTDYDTLLGIINAELAAGHGKALLFTDAGQHPLEPLTVAFRNSDAVELTFEFDSATATTLTDLVQHLIERGH